jgi:hypothetical protein
LTRKIDKECSFRETSQDCKFKIIEMENELKSINDQKGIKET